MSPPSSPQHRPTSQTETLLNHLQSLYLRARFESHPPSIAARHAVQTHSHPPPQSSTAPHSHPLHHLRKELATLHNRGQISACQDLFMTSYKRTKALELRSNLLSLFQSQYTPLHHPTSQPIPSAPRKKKLKPPLLGCEHYARNCKLKAACCGLFVPCRFCHDTAMADDHEMDRFATQSVLCMVCLSEQPVGPRCVKCSIPFAHYYCSHCRFFENSPGKQVYHCHRCNICRLGRGLGFDNFHCDNCDACVALESKAHHRCLSNALHTNCPVCRGYLFTSTEPVVFMRCGHTMHSLCFDEYTIGSYQCPLCMRSLTNMDSYFQQIDELLLSEPMPPEYAHKRSHIFCNDCSSKCLAAYHFMYHKCASPECGSYNTKVLDVLDLHPDPHMPDEHPLAECPPITGEDIAIVDSLSHPTASSSALTRTAQPPAFFPFLLEPSLDVIEDRPADQSQFAKSPAQSTVRG